MTAKPKEPVSGNQGGSAAMQARMWGERAEDWAEVMEGENGWGVPAYRHVAERVGLGDGDRVLDIGCGAGRFCQLAASAGAKVAGLDATPAFIEIARARVLDGDFREGDMESLPWEDDSFDLITGFNSFFIAADMVRALSEARRVARPGGQVAMTVFGRPEKCDSTSVFRVLGELMPTPPVAAESGVKEEPPAPLYEEGALEAIVRKAGLEPSEAGYLPFTEDYASLDAVIRGMGAAPPFRRAAGIAGEDALRAGLEKALSGFVLADGSCRLQEEVRFLVATAS